ncbi:MAG: TonB-dependent receptor [Saprospiraceae bacterium]|jgi:outer membrane receptor protein involved in Fe transport|nr:TonB-dependent receptor [Saprospiraceae bacterium]
MRTKLITLIGLLFFWVKMTAQERAPEALPMLPLTRVTSWYFSGTDYDRIIEEYKHGYRLRIPPYKVYLPSVVVTAQRMESDANKTPASIVTARFWEGNRTVPEALTTSSGVFVQKTNHGGGSPFVRGLTGNQTLLLIDGIRLSNATFRYGPNQYLNTIDPYSIQNMEVLKGGGSVGYGSDALGGTLNVLSRDMHFTSTDRVRWQNKITSYWRNQDMEKTLHAESNFSNRKLAFHMGGTLRNFGDLVGGDTTGVQRPTGYDEMAFDLKVKLRLDTASTLTVMHQFFQQTDVPIFHKIQLEDFARNLVSLQRRQLSYARYEWLAPQLRTVWGTEGRSLKTGLQKITITASLQNTDEHRESQKNGSPMLRKEADDVRSLGVSALAKYKFAEWWLSTIGIETYHDLVSSNRTNMDTGTGSETDKRGLYPDGATHLSSAIFCTNQWESGDWNFTGGLRFNHFSIKVEDENIGEAHLTPSAFVWNAGALRKLGKSDAAFFSFNTAFRAPNVDDLGTLGIVDFRYELPTADLKPEKSYNMELGWRHQRENWSANLAVFRNELRDLITRVRVGADSIAGYPVYQKENVQEGFIQGIEFSGSLSLTNGFLLHGNLAWQYGQNVTDNEPLRRIPPFFGNLSLQYGGGGNYSKRLAKYQNWWGTLEWLFAAKQGRLAAGDKADNRIPLGGTPGWNVLNLNGYWRFSKSRYAMTLRAGLWNIFNADYRYHGSGVNGVGRSVTAGVTVGF